MSCYVTKTLQPGYAEHTVYYCFDNKNNHKKEQTNKRPIQQENTDQETETKTKKQKKIPVKNPVTKPKTSKKVPTIKKKKINEYNFINGKNT